MKNRIYKSFSIVLLTAILWVGSCTDRLEVENYNSPDRTKALNSAEDVVNLAGGAFRIWYNGTQEYDGPGLAMATMADQLTCSWGNAAMRDLSSEPRTGWNNNVTYSNSPVNRVFWQNMYSALSQANDALLVLNSGKDFGDDAKMVEAWSRFIQGITLGYVALTFDKGVIADESTDLGSLSFSTYQEVGAAAVGYLDEAIAICEENTFDVPASFINGHTFTNVELGQLANSFAARILIFNSRNATQNSAVKWDKVLQYAQNGIDFDLNILGNDYWYDAYKDYAVYNGWGRIDHRIINLMDTDYPSRWPSSGAFPDPQEASSNDARLDLYFEYLPEQAFNPSRGTYHFSHYRLKRWDYWSGDYFVAVPNFLAAENDLMIAEAQARTNNLAGAIATINAGSRTNIGDLPNLASNSTLPEVLEAIFYERDIELAITGMGISFFDMRRRDMLQKGTILHFPIPALELEALNKEWYTIEGAPDSENISNGSWTGKDGLVSPPPAK